MSVILRYVLCNEEAAVVKETFFGYLRISDSTGKGLLDAFLEKATELQLELSDCRGQSYDNGANMKGKHSGVQARMLDINPKAVYVPCANHTLNLVVVDSANSSTEALSFFGVLTRLYVLFSSSAQRWEILKKHVELSIKSQSDTRWESRIKCIKPLRYNLKEVLLALKDLEAISIERKDGRAASETKSLIAHLSKWSCFCRCLFGMISYSKSIKQARFFNRMESPFIQWKRKSRQLKSFCKTIAQRVMTVPQHLLLK